MKSPGPTTRGTQGELRTQEDLNEQNIKTGDTVDVIMTDVR